MCGINGILSADKLRAEQNRQTIKRMNRSLLHRGPDRNDSWDSDDSIFFGHTRLSIIDLSENGNQPFVSNSKKIILTFNGEIYNTDELNFDLKKNGIPLKGHSDTEVLAELIDLYGVELALTKCVGMFAFGAWNTQTKTLTLARDRMGEKPLHYGLINGDFYFSSEIKALHQAPSFSKKLDKKSLSYFFKYNYIPDPKTIFEGVKKLGAGTYINGTQPEELFANTPVKYWQNRAPKSTHSTRDLSYSQAAEQLDKMLLKTVRREMVADAPLGVFLSGGVDSSLITALAQSQAKDRVKTFSIGFQESEYDETKKAAKVANHLGTDHTEWILGENDILDLVPSLAEVFDEPFSDSSQLPTLLLAKMTRSQVKVALSGDGGDELFAGYNRYNWVPRLHSKLSLLPPSLRKSLFAGALSRPNSFARKILANLMSSKFSNVEHKLDKLTSLLSCSNHYELFDRTLSHTDNIQSIFPQGQTVSLVPHGDLTSKEFTNWMIAHDQNNYLPFDILTKVDRSTMHFNLETRAPFLDHNIVEFANSLPLEYKLGPNGQKLILKNLLQKYVPSQITESPKQGFSVPIDKWLKNELKDWVIDTLNENQLAKHGLLSTSTVIKIRDEHLSGRKNWPFVLWDLLVFQSWHNRWMS